MFDLFIIVSFLVLAFRPFLGRRSLGEVGWPSPVYKTGMQLNLTGKVGIAASKQLGWDGSSLRLRVRAKRSPGNLNELKS
jgi:hypothetical protein